jgi:hypothetical protein
LALGLGGCVACAEIGTELWYRAHERALAAPVRWTLKLPDYGAGPRDLELAKSSRQFLRFDKSLNAIWEDSAGLRWQAIFLSWSPSHVAPRLARNHAPELCLAASGFEPVQDRDMHLISVRGLNLPFRFYSAKDRNGPFHVFYCLWEDRGISRQFDGDLQSYYNRLASVVAARRNCGQRSLELALWGAPDLPQAEVALRNLLPDIITVEK